MTKRTNYIGVFLGLNGIFCLRNLCSPTSIVSLLRFFLIQCRFFVSCSIFSTSYHAILYYIELSPFLLLHFFAVHRHTPNNRIYYEKRVARNKTKNKNLSYVQYTKWIWTDLDLSCSQAGSIALSAHCALKNDISMIIYDFGYFHIFPYDVFPMLDASNNRSCNIFLAKKRHNSHSSRGKVTLWCSSYIPFPSGCISL